MTGCMGVSFYFNLKVAIIIELGIIGLNPIMICYINAIELLNAFAFRMCDMYDSLF